MKSMVIPVMKDGTSRGSRNAEDYEGQMIRGYVVECGRIPLFINRDERKGGWYIRDTGTGYLCLSRLFRTKKEAAEYCPVCAEKLVSFWDNEDNARYYDKLCEIRQDVKKRYLALHPTEKENI